jgi:hypothetical protein
MKGVNLLSSLARYGDIALPIAYEPVKKEILFCDIATRKVKRQSSISKNQMFRSMIAQAMANKLTLRKYVSDSK